MDGFAIFMLIFNFCAIVGHLALLFWHLRAAKRAYKVAEKNGQAEYAQKRKDVDDLHAALQGEKALVEEHRMTMVRWENELRGRAESLEKKEKALKLIKKQLAEQVEKSLAEADKDIKYAPEEMPF